MNIAEATAKADAAHDCGKLRCAYSKQTCPEYWRQVFEAYFGVRPLGDTDSRWNELFKLSNPQPASAPLR